MINTAEFQQRQRQELVKGLKAERQQAYKNNDWDKVNELTNKICRIEWNIED